MEKCPRNDTIRIDGVIEYLAEEGLRKNQSEFTRQANDESQEYVIKKLRERKEYK